MPKRALARVNRCHSDPTKKAKHAPCRHRPDLDLNHDSDDEPPSEEQLDWRQDPVESLSDWTIEIETVGAHSRSVLDDEDAGSSTVLLSHYHVHKSVLAIGARKCEYFARLFLARHSFVETRHSTSRIELHPLAAACFPQFLDYMYGVDGWNISTESATALHYLGQYFENRRLRWEAKQFWKRDMNFQNLGTYYAHATVFHDAKIIRSVVDACAQNMYKMSPDLSIMQTSTPQLWLDVLRRDPNSCSQSQTTSTVVATFCSIHARVIDKATFEELTSSIHLPHIHVSVALTLMNLERQIASVAADPVVDLSSNNNNNSLSNLQERCVASLHQNWNKVPALVHNQGDQNRLLQHSPTLLVHLLASAQSDVIGLSKWLEKAKRDIIRLKDEVFEKGREVSRQRRMHMLAATSSSRSDNAMARPFSQQRLLSNANRSEGSRGQPLAMPESDDDDSNDDDSDSDDVRHRWAVEDNLRGLAHHNSSSDDSSTSSSSTSSSDSAP